MVSKCEKCGADIPDTATFCPSCGAPKGMNQPQPQPAQQYQSKPMGNMSQGSMEDLAKTLFSRKMLILGLFIGVLLLVISSFMINFTEPNVWDDMHMQHFGTVLRSISYYGMGLLLICVGLINDTFNKFYRLGMIIAGGFILA